jgi:glucose-1-phosphate thymidylyltransferase
MKAIIPVAGAGLRLRPHTNTQPKPLLPVAGKPIMAFIIEELLEAGVTDFVFVIGYLGDKIRHYIETKHSDLKVTFVVQEERLGLGHAIWTAASEIRHEQEVLILLGDTIVDIDMRAYMSVPHSCLAVKQVSDPRNFGVVELDTTGRVTRLVEKPRIPKSNLALVGLYKIREVGAMLDALDYQIRNRLHQNGEFYFTDALMYMLEQGVVFHTMEVKTWFDCGKKEILLHTNSILLDKIGMEADSAPYDNTVIIHPVHIGAHCDISNSIIGPHVTIGDNTRIEASIIRDSIIGSFTVIEETVLHHSIIGSDSAVHGLSQSLNLGDNTEIDFS